MVSRCCEFLNVKPSLHYVAVKVVDNDGLESVQVAKLEVNGKVEIQP